MNAQTLAKSDTASPPTNPQPEAVEPQAIAIQDRLVAAMFLVVGLLFVVIIVADLFVGFFR